MQQLPLGLRWPAQQRFESYVAGDNGAVIGVLQRAATQAHSMWVFVNGGSASGKTHLLIAACAAANENERTAQYLSLSQLSASRGDDGGMRRGPADALRSLGGSDVLALDDIQAIAGDAAAEHALFDLYNRCKAEQSTLLFAATKPPGQLGIALPDLISRLSICTQIVLKPLSELERREALRQRAATRGLTLDDVVLDWLFARTQRDLGSLSVLLDRIDRESLAAQRRVTIPFLRQLLEDDLPRG